MIPVLLSEKEWGKVTSAMSGQAFDLRQDVELIPDAEEIDEITGKIEKAVHTATGRWP